jgi:hypothetical protein
LKAKQERVELYIEHKKRDISTVARDFILDKIYPNEYANLENGKKSYRDKLSDETSHQVSMTMWGSLQVILFYQK